MTNPTVTLSADDALAILDELDTRASQLRERIESRQHHSIKARPVNREQLAKVEALMATLRAQLGELAQESE